MDNRRKLIRVINLLLLFFIAIFSFFKKIDIIIVLVLFFLIWNTIRLILKKIGVMQLFQQRSYLFSLAVILFFAILSLRLVQIQLVKYKKFMSLSKQQSYGKYFLKGKRGKILDSTGKELAYDINIYKVIIDPKRFYTLKDRNIIIKKLQIIKPFNIKIFSEKLKKGYETNRRYMVIMKNINEVEKSNIDNIISKYHVLYNEIYFEHTTQREYLSYHELAPTIGFMGAFKQDENRKVGAYGIERYYDKYLKENIIEQNGYYSNFRNLLLPSIKKNSDFMPKNGNNVQLTIDYYIQYILDDEMQKQIKKVDPTSAVGVVMDPSNGKILALSSYPRATNIAYLNNRVLRSQYEMGSIFKPLVLAAAYEEGIVDDNTRLNNPNGYIIRYSHKIRDSDSHGIGILTPKKTVVVSSNVGMSLISEKISPDIFEKYLKKFNLYNKTGIDTFGELAPRQLPYQKWDGLKKYTMSYGQGIAITPIQMISSISSLVNGGIYYKPYIVDKIKTADGITIKQNVPIAERRVISKNTSKIINNMLKETVEKGTGKNARISGYSIGGKTGTAQISSRGGYLKQEYLSSFIGVFPVEHPKYIILIMFEKPHAKSHWKKFGAWIAAPVFKSVLSRILTYKGIGPKNEILLSKENKSKISSKNSEIKLLPDFKKVGLEKALFIAKKYGIQLDINGHGSVINQKPLPGVDLKKVTKILINLR